MADENEIETQTQVLDCESLKVKIKTSSQLHTYAKVVVKCDVKCSLAHQNTYKKLMEVDKTDRFGYGIGAVSLLDDYNARAKRIAATYARFYLEEETSGNKALKGRFYWMGLGAFASKTVACGLSAWQVKYLASSFGDVGMKSIYETLAKGNFWLFQDIASWHFLYNICSSDKEYLKTDYKKVFTPCMNMKHVDKLCETPKDIIKTKLPWAEESLAIIGNLALPKGGKEPESLEKGMKLVHDIEDMIFNNKKDEFIQKAQLSHLLEIAKHEQGNVLQPLVYDDPSYWPTDFQDWAAFMRGTTNLQRWIKDKATWWVPGSKVIATVPYVMPALELIFTSTCNIYTQEEIDKLISKPLKQDEIISKAPDDTVLEDYKSRMKWIKEAAADYHDLMINNKEYMEKELSTITTWENEQDSFSDLWSQNGLATKEY